MSEKLPETIRGEILKPFLPPSLGLSGIWATIANFSAVVLLGVMFWVQSDRMHSMAQEDRAMCREESRLQWLAVKEGQQAILRLTRSVEEISVEVRALRAIEEARSKNPK